VDKEFGNLPGGMQIMLLLQPLFQVSPCNPMQKMDGKAVIGSDPLNFLKFAGWGLKHPGQGTKVGQKGPGLLLAVFPGRAENKQKFQHLCIGECVYALLLKFIP
jgi:hypothetical protein